MLIITPPFCFSICGTTACEVKNVPFRFVSKNLSRYASSTSRKGLLSKIPALFISTSMLPNFSKATSANHSPVFLSFTLPATIARLLPPPNCWYTRSNFSGVVELMTTLSPFSKKYLATPSPIPDDAPVTIIVCLLIILFFIGSNAFFT